MTSEIEKNIYLDMGNDALFKAMFRNDCNKRLVARIISCITGIEEDMLMRAKIRGGEISKRHSKEKGKTSDILIFLEDNTVIIVEMNNFYYKNLFKKNISYAFATYVRNNHIKESVYPKIILLNIDNFSVFKDQVVPCFMMQDKFQNVEIDNFTSFHFVIENASNCSYNEIDEVLVRFARFMSCKNLDDLRKVSEGDDDFMFLFDMVNGYVTEDDRVVMYDREELHEWEKNECRKDGLEEGIIQGIEQGIEQGQKEIIVQMKNSGLTLEKISQITEMSISQIKKILNN